jgi:hypothetical protein
MVGYLFRKPKYPLLIETDRRVVGARSGKRIDRLFKEDAFVNKKNHIVIDSNGEGWSFVPEHDVISPLTMLKRWSKLEIIKFFNSLLEKDGSISRYEPRSLSNKRLEQVIREIVEFDEQTLANYLERK